MHAHETTPTSVYKLSHTHIVVALKLLAVFALVCTFPAFSWGFEIVAGILVSSFFVCFWIRGSWGKLTLYARMYISHCHTDWLLPWFLLFHLFASFDSPLQSPRLQKHFGVSFVLIRFVIGELLSEVGGRVGHGLVLAWFELYVLRLVCLDSSLQLPGQE